MIVISQTFAFLVNEYFTPEWQKNVRDITREVVKCSHEVYFWRCSTTSFIHIIIIVFHIDVISSFWKCNSVRFQAWSFNFFFIVKRKNTRIIRFENTDKQVWAKKLFCWISAYDSHRRNNTTLITNYLNAILLLKNKIKYVIPRFSKSFWVLRVTPLIPSHKDGFLFGFFAFRFSSRLLLSRHQFPPEASFFSFHLFWRMSPLP